MRKFYCSAISIVMFTFGMFYADNLYADTKKTAATVAAIYSKTGNAAYGSEFALTSIRLAVRGLNQDGGLLGRKIELIEMDNASTPLGSKKAAEKAVEMGVVAVIGPSRSSHSLGAAPVLQKAGIPMIASDSTNPDVTKVGNYIFRACFIDPFQGKVMATFAVRDLNAKTAVVLTNAGQKYSRGLAEFFIRSFRELGGNVLWEGKYLKETANFAPLIAKVKELAPDVVFVPGYAKDSGFIIREAVKAGVWQAGEHNAGAVSVEFSYAVASHVAFDEFA